MKNPRQAWEAYKAEYRKQNALPLPVGRFWLALSLLLIMLLVSLILIFSGEAATGMVSLPISLIIAIMVYNKRPDKYRSPSS